jgi:hypothetical protein
MTAIDALPIVVAPISTAVIAVMQAWFAYRIKMVEAKTAENGAKTDAVKLAVERTMRKVDEVHTVTNSSFGSMQEQNKALIHATQEQKEIITRLTPPPESIVTLTQKVSELTSRLDAAAMLKPGGG